MLFGFRCSVFGARCLVFDFWHSVCGARFLVLGFGARVLGAWFLVFGFWCSVFGPPTWRDGRGQVPKTILADRPRRERNGKTKNTAGTTVYCVMSAETIPPPHPRSAKSLKKVPREGDPRESVVRNVCSSRRVPCWISFYLLYLGY